VPDIQEAYLGPEDFLFLCCDGIFESQTNEAIIQYLHDHLNKVEAEPGKVLSDLLYKMLVKGSKDNMTAILVEPKNGENFNRPDEFVVGEWYKHGNDTYVEAFQVNCARHGKTVEEVRQLWFAKKKEQGNFKLENGNDDASEDSSSSSDSDDAIKEQNGDFGCNTEGAATNAPPALPEYENDSIISMSGRGKPRGLLENGLGSASASSLTTTPKLGGVLAKFASLRRSPASSDNSLLSSLKQGMNGGSIAEQDGVKQVQSETALHSPDANRRNWEHEATPEKSAVEPVKPVKQETTTSPDSTTADSSANSCQPSTTDLNSS